MTHTLVCVLCVCVWGGSEGEGHQFCWCPPRAFAAVPLLRGVERDANPVIHRSAGGWGWGR